MPSLLLALALGGPAAQAGPWDRPEIAEEQRQQWSDWLYVDGHTRFVQGRIMALAGGGAVIIGAGFSLAETLENRPSTDGLRPGAIVAMAGTPFLLAGIPSMASGTLRMRSALRNEGILRPNVAGIAAWVFIAGAVATPITGAAMRAGAVQTLLVAGSLLTASYYCSSLQYTSNRQEAHPRIMLAPIAGPGTGGLRLSTSW